MARAFDGSYAPDTLPAMPCGGVPTFDEGSGGSYRCDACFSTLGSIGQSQECRDAMNTPEYQKTLKDFHRRDRNF